MKKSETYIRNSIKDLMSNSSLAVLATNSGNYPYVSLVGFAFSEDLKEIYFATLANTSKYRNIIRRPGVSLLIDSRQNSDADFKEAKALTVLGEANVLTGEDRDKTANLYLLRFPQLESFIENPDCAVIKISAAKYILVERFKEVMEIKIR